MNLKEVYIAIFILLPSNAHLSQNQDWDILNPKFNKDLKYQST